MQEPSVAVHLLSEVEYELCHKLQRRLVEDSAHTPGARITLLLSEHPPTITVGRGGSRSHIRLKDDELERRKLQVRWISRGGGCIFHAPGQIAIYPIVPLDECGWSIGYYMQQLHMGLAETITELGVTTHRRSGSYGVWGRKGLLAACGVGVRYDVAYHGAFLNVCPPMDVTRRLDVAWSRPGDPDRERVMSSLVTESRRPARMPRVRAVLIEKLTQALGCSAYHMHTGHPELIRIRERYPT